MTRSCQTFTIKVLLTAACLLTLAFTVSASDPKFRRPITTLSSPIYSALYDHDTGTRSKNYWCGGETIYNGHRGTDFRAAVGTPVFAAAAGGLYYRYNGCPTYGYFGSSCGGGFGNHVRIDHEGKETDGVGLLTIYGHLQKDTAVYPSSVPCGSLIGKSGSSGSSTGPHLHFEVRKKTYPFDDPFSGTCSQSASLWVNQNGGVPTTQCQ
jgi:murein DD-endopeptidase MepM/ murein hydrolase activator NlpD